MKHSHDSETWWTQESPYQHCGKVAVFWVYQCPKAGLFSCSDFIFLALWTFSAVALNAISLHNFYQPISLKLWFTRSPPHSDSWHWGFLSLLGAIVDVGVTYYWHMTKDKDQFLTLPCPSLCPAPEDPLACLYPLNFPGRYRSAH
jgi:hypothetical protein